MKYEIEIYKTATHKIPFLEWIDDLRDDTIKAKIQMRIRRAGLGNFGDWKKIKHVQGLYEMREHSGGGYRIFYTITEGRIILLLAGSDKKYQVKTIKKAEAYIADYLRRK